MNVLMYIPTLYPMRNVISWCSNWQTTTVKLCTRNKKLSWNRNSGISNEFVFIKFSYLENCVKNVFYVKGLNTTHTLAKRNSSRDEVVRYVRKTTFAWNRFVIQSGFGHSFFYEERDAVQRKSLPLFPVESVSVLSRSII